MITKIKEYLKNNLKPSRYTHILGVADTACLIGKYNNLDIEILRTAALLHDISKSMSLEELKELCVKHNVAFDPIEEESHGLLHAYGSAILAKELYGIENPDILNAIRSHTVAKVNMSPYEEVIFVADFCEPSRKIKKSKNIMEKAFSNLRAAVLDVLSSKLTYVIEKKLTVHPKSILAYNYYRLYKS